MLETKMYVRCPYDMEHPYEPRIFVCGQVLKIDNFKKVAEVQVHDPFGYSSFYDYEISGRKEFPLYSIERCHLFVGSSVLFENETYTIKAYKKLEDDFFYYFVQNIENKRIIKVSEKEIIASFNNGKVDPTSQLKRLELQNPCWNLGRAIVSRNMNILNNSIYGFKELAGAKIYLLPHQVNTIMRCLQESPCRYMLADEVGMGKTIEAICIYKIFAMNRCDLRTLIVVPKALKSQWISELYFKFDIRRGLDENNNYLDVVAIEELNDGMLKDEWDFIIVDEVHKYLKSEYSYNILERLSRQVENILLLSATPVQQREEEYLDLLKLLQPERYERFDLEKFKKLIEKQNLIIQKTALILDDLGDYEDEIRACEDDECDAHNSEDCSEIFEDIVEDLESICTILNDEKLDDLLDKIKFESDDMGVYNMKVILSYICGNYQIESNIIRNRRRALEKQDEDKEQILATRNLIEKDYFTDSEHNLFEYLVYEEITQYVIKNISEENIEDVVMPILSRYFSSPWALKSYIDEFNPNIDELLYKNVVNWVENENYNIEHLGAILDDPDNFAESYATRLVVVMDALYDDLYDEKVVLFTNYSETFKAYQKALLQVFDENYVSFFSEDMTSEELEENIIKYQSNEDCKIMLCDYTGGEGRNFQCADYLIHIDLPWDASSIEQRIGRLDRLERDMSRSIVNSVVVHTKGTFEESLFTFFKDGLEIFSHSLSGMEIIMGDINNEIKRAVKEDFKYGLIEKIPEIIELASKMREEVRKEQHFDAAGFIYRPMYTELKRLINYYARNENELFSNTMSDWANLAGFHGIKKSNGEIQYSAESFSPRSAIKSQLAPPKLIREKNYEIDDFLNIDKKQGNKLRNYNDNRFIRGTFSRKLAIENDYLHFFAPGDEIFDCVVENAINSCKGCCSAYAVKSKLSWCGMIFSWSIEPNNYNLIENKISAYGMSIYRNYLFSEQIIVPISIENYDDISDDQIKKEFLSIMNLGFTNAKFVHLGKRTKEPLFMKDKIKSRNIDWFRNTYCHDDWKKCIADARKESHDKALDIVRRRSNLGGAKEEMDRVLSAKEAKSRLYDLKDNELENIKVRQNIILDSLKKPRLSLDAIAFVIMDGDNNGW